MDTNLLISLLVIVLVFMGYLMLSNYLRRQESFKNVKDRLGADGTLYNDEEDLFEVSNEKTDLAASLESIIKMMGVDTERTIFPLSKKFMQAGLNAVNGPIYYLFWQRILSVVFILLAYLFFSSSAPDDKLLNGAVAGLMVIIGVFGPYLYLTNAITKRTNVLTISFPDALDLMLVCVESGLGLDAALAKVCAELGSVHPEITKELNKTRLELAMLNDRSKALMNLGERTNLVPFRSLVAALIQTERFGTSLSDTLRVLSEDYRMTRLMLAEQKAGRIPVLITLPLILCLLPALFIIILGPVILKVSAQGGIFGKASGG